MSLISVIMNLQNHAVTQYSNHDFNSFCKIGDTIVAANDTGLFSIGGDDDNGEDIDAYFALVTSDFGIENIKRIRTAYVGGRMDGNLTLTLEDDEGNARTYDLVPLKSDKQTALEANIDRDGASRYWMVKISNANGADFRIDHISIAPVILTKKPRLRPLNTWGEVVASVPAITAALSE
jgi:hypothetical protein